MLQRIATLALAFLIGVAIAVALPNQEAAAVTRWAPVADRTKTICIDDGPSGISDSTARNRLADAIATWETTGGIDGVPAVDFTATTNCGSADVVVTAENIDGPYYAYTTQGGDIIFDDHSVLEYAGGSTVNFDWFGAGTRPSGWVSYEGILLHEMGHALGIGHSGNSYWSDDVASPSMRTCATPNMSEDWETIQRDDWGNAVNIGGHSTGKPAYLNANPGFERQASHWSWSNSGDVAIAGAYKKTGAYGARLKSGRWMWAGTSYDPWVVDEDGNVEAADNMTQNSVTFTMSSYGRHAYGGETGGLKFKYNQRSIDYGDVDGCKESGSSPGNWGGQVTVGSTCNLSSTSWQYCARTFNLTFSVTLPAKMIRPLYVSTATSYIYLDRTGLTGGTQS